MSHSEEEYYHKADNLIRLSCQAVQDIFRDRWKRLTGKPWTEESADTFINGDGKVFYSNCKPIQKRLLREGNLEKWDLTLLSGVLRSLDSALQKNDQLALQGLCFERNKVAHNAQKKITPASYQDHENAIRRCLSSLGLNQNKIDTLISHAGVTSSVAALEQAKKIQMKGDKAYSQKKYQEAKVFYEEALLVPSLLPVNLCTLYEKKASCYLALGQQATDKRTKDANYEQAMSDIKKALEYNESSWKAHSTIARVYKARNDMEKAIEHFTQALAISPGQANLKTELDDCKLLNGRMFREDHMDPFKMPQTLKEITEHYSKTTGCKLTPAMFLEAQKGGDKFLPGYSDVKTGHCYANGWNVEQNYQEAARHYTKAMSKGNAEGIYNLALLYTDGNGVHKDVAYATELLKKAANMPEKVKVFGSWHVDIGVMAAQQCLGLRYDEGIGVAQDDSQAAEWYSKAALNGCGNAANNLAILYYNGRGVKKDLKMAEMYWKKSTEAGNNNAAYSLCVYYVEEMEPQLARQFMKKTVQLQHSRMPYIKEDMEKIIEKVAEKRAGLEEHVVKFETKKGLSKQGLTFRQRSDRMLVGGVHEMAMTQESEEEFKIDPDEAAENFAKLLKSNPFSLFQGKNDLIHSDNNLGWAGMFRGDFDFNQIVKRAEEGSITAKRIMTVMGYNLSFHQLWNQGPPFSTQRAKNLLQFVYLRICMEHHIFYFNSTEMMAQFQTFLNSMFETHGSSTSDLDKKVRLCYAFHVRDKGPQFRLQILKEGIRRYPNEVAYYYALTCMYGELNENDLGLEVAIQGLQQFPDSVELLYDKAVHTRLSPQTNKNAQEVRNAYMDFLRVAPEDHRKVPEAYYCIALNYFNQEGNGKNAKLFEEIQKIKKMVQKYFEDGMRAERKQLSCYLPYESTTKSYLQQFILMMGISKPNGNGESGSTVGAQKHTSASVPLPKVVTSQSKTYLKDPKRIEIIKAHRESLKSVSSLQQRIKDEGLNEVQMTAPPTLHHKLPKNLCNLQEITLQEMDPTEDTVYEKKLLNLTLIDDPQFGFASIHLVAMDDNKDATRLFVYNVPQDEEMREKLAFGSRLSIINPYLRLCRDGKNAIRVDEPKCIVYMEKAKNMCRYCGEENAEKTCARCKRAMYCSKECQTADWKKLDHKLICTKPCENDKNV